MDINETKEKVYTISSAPGYSGYMHVKLIEQNNNTNVELFINHPLRLSESMIDDLIIALQQAKTFIT